jgi:hypothetical protein
VAPDSREPDAALGDQAAREALGGGQQLGGLGDGEQAIFFAHAA